MTVSLEFIVTPQQRVLDAQLDTRDRLSAIESRLGSLEKQREQQRDENMVTTGLVLRYAGEHIAWAGMQAELRKLLDRVDALEKRPPR